jgi:hypothetical protein
METTSGFIAKRIKASSIYRLLLIGTGIPLNILCLIYGVLGLLGYDTVKYNGSPIHGLLALPAGIVLGMLFTVALTAIFGDAEPSPGRGVPDG